MFENLRRRNDRVTHPNKHPALPHFLNELVSSHTAEVYDALDVAQTIVVVSVGPATDERKRRCGSGDVVGYEGKGVGCEGAVETGRGRVFRVRR
jgi:hypothetical protein